MKNFLKYINSLPIAYTMKHYYVFDDVTNQLKNTELNSRESWDMLRKSHHHFSIPDRKEDWIKGITTGIKKDGQDGGLQSRVVDVVMIIDQLQITSIFSVGVGGAGLEYLIKKSRPHIHMTCSEYAPENVSVLQKVFTEADAVIQFDMLRDQWSIARHGGEASKQLCLLYRVDINFTDTELKEIFHHMRDAGIEHVLVIACGVLTLRGFWNRLRQRTMWNIRRVPYVFAGYVRTRKQLEQDWNECFVSTPVNCGGLQSFILKKKDGI